MAKEKGTNVLLHVSEDDSPETFVAVAGQRDTRMQGAGNPIDTSDKTTGGWGTSISGTRQITVTCSGLANWPDTTGLDLVRQRWAAGTTIRVKVVLNSTGDAYVFDAAITQLDIGGAHDGATEFSFTLQNSDAPDYLAGS